ncbi:hypothetical protein [Streptomyces acidiscabies]|uniref:Uncharacterized protein n=1 Tax=Streptomyces acidiscabies TaxID=42234 RepID=A0A0L0K738_9ACTN|nr:hypothetical protein [Streptomyces acidiscabies]KND33499.1 hypothetical protein IQ63_18995 [Streptomyces acidiscabies]
MIDVEPFWTDCAPLDRAGTPSVRFGVDGEGAHADTEYVDLASLDRLIAPLPEHALHLRVEIEIHPAPTRGLRRRAAVPGDSRRMDLTEVFQRCRSRARTVAAIGVIRFGLHRDLGEGGT